MLWLPIITGQRAPSTLFFFIRFGFVIFVLVFVFLGVFFVVVFVLCFVLYVFAFSWSEVLVRRRGFANIYTGKAAVAAVQPS